MDTGGASPVLLHVVFGPTPEPARTPLVSNRGGRPRSNEASSLPRLQAIAPGPPGFSKSYQDHHHKAEWLVLQLTKLPETNGRPPSKAPSRPKVVGFGSNLHHTPGVSPSARRQLPRIGGHRSPTVAFVQTPRPVLEEACLSIRCQRCRPLAEAIPLRVPTFETGFGGSFFPSNITKPQKMSPTSSTHRSHEDVLLRRSQSASPGTHSALCRSCFGLSLASTQQVSNQRLLDLGLADKDVSFQSRFLSLGLKFFLLFSGFLPSQPELFHRLAVGPSHQNLDGQTP